MEIDQKEVNLTHSGVLNIQFRLIGLQQSNFRTGGKKLGTDDEEPGRECIQRLNTRYI